MASWKDWLLGSSSPPPPPVSSPQAVSPPVVLEEKPWRETFGWGKSVRRKLMSEVKSLRPEPSLLVPSFHILLTGQIGSGKSSFFNSINSVLKGVVGAKAMTGVVAESLTKEFYSYPVARNLPIRICDTMGLQQNTSEVDIRNLLIAAEGHVPRGYKFTIGEEYHVRSPGYIANPTIADSAHCVVIVINATVAIHMESVMVRKLKSLAEGLYSRKIPVFVVLTHMDEFCPEVRKDVTKVYHSIAVRKLVHKISSIVNGLPESQIFPVINYSKVLELKDNMDILLLYALRQMLILAEEHLEIHREQLTIEPWRNLKGWDRSVRDELKEHVASLAPVTSDEITVPTFNILLTGQIGAGKSSFFNSLNSLFRNRIIAGKADTGLKTAESWTKEFRIYNLITPDHNIPSPLPWRICDTMGLNDNTDESDIRNVLKAVDGHVPNKYTFTVGIDFDNECPGFVVNPTLAEKAHCIAVVVDASKVKVMKTDMWYKLRSLREGFISRNIPTYIILTHIDQACEKVNKDVQHVYRSIIIRDIVATVGKELLGLPENQIFPVRNYEKEDDLYDDMDILLLHAVRQMLYSAQGHIENKM